jgi:aspartate aminotransferase
LKELSIKALAVKESSTLAITAKAKALKASGENLIAFTAGEPDFDTPEHIKEAAFSAAREGFTKYTATPGIPELRKAICDKLKK